MKCSLKYLRCITVEPFMFIFVFSFAITYVTQITFMMDKICRTEMDFSDDICTNLLKDSSLLFYKQEVQKRLSYWLYVIKYMQDIPSLLLSLVIGPWSDKYGRKKPMLLVLIMRTLTFGGFLLTAIIPSTPTYGVVLSWIPTCTFGGFIFMLCLSYISDITKPEERTRRLAILSGISFLGHPLGILIGSYIFEYGGFIAVYSIATILSFLACLYICIRINETRDNSELNFEKVKDLFKFTNIKDSFKTTFKKRSGKRRRHIIICTSALGLVSIAFSVIGISYQYAQLLYTWANKEYALFFSITSFFNKSANIFLTPVLSKNLHFKETSIGIIGIISMICSRIMTSLAKEPGAFWAGGVFEGLVFMSSVSSRSILSTTVHPDEVGKAFGVASAFESIGGFIGGLVIQQVYKATLVIFPSCSFIVSGFVGIILLILYLWMDLDFRIKDRTTVTSAMDEASNEEEKNPEISNMKSASIASGLDLAHMKAL